MTEKNTLPAFAADLSSALKEFHRALIHAEIGEDPILRDSPYSALFAMIGDPRFAWMGELSQLIARIDQLVADGEADEPETIAELTRTVENMIGQGEGAAASSFRMRHVMALQKDPEVGLATGRLRKALSIRPVAVK